METQATPTISEVNGNSSFDDTGDQEKLGSQIIQEQNQAKIHAYLEQLKTEQNFAFAAITATGAAILAAIAWAIITGITKYQIGFMAIGVGYLVGKTVAHFGKGIETKFAFLGSALALFGCLLGNLLSVIFIFASESNLSFVQVFTHLDLSLIPSIFVETFQAMDVLFYGIAIYEAYRFSLREIDLSSLELS